MSVQFRPITGREDGDWFDEEEPFRIPPSYMLVDNGLVWAWSPNGCYRCSFRYLESAMVFTFLDRWGYRHDRIVAWNVWIGLSHSGQTAYNLLCPPSATTKGSMPLVSMK